MAVTGLSRRLGMLGAWVALIAVVAFSAQGFSAEAEKPAEQKTEAKKERGALGRFWDRILLDLKIGVTADIELIKGLKTALGYRYGIEPSYEDGYQWRMDSGRIEAGVNIGELLSHENPRFTIGGEGGVDFTLVRPFKNESDARTAWAFGYDPKRLLAKQSLKEEIVKWLPFTAERAITNFNVGDLFTFKAELNVMAGASTLPLLDTRMGQAFTHYIISGAFQVHLVRLPNDKVEMRLVAIRQEKKGGGISAGFGTGHKVVGVRIIDRRIEKVLNVTEFFRMDWDDKKSSLQLCQYRLDLKSPRVREAYDGLATRLMHLMDTVKIANPTQTIDELSGKLISDITPFDSIYKEELAAGAKSEPKRGEKAFTVDRSFKGRNVVDDSNFSNFKFAPIIFNFKDGKEYYENMMSTENPDGSKEHYRLHTYKRTTSMAWWLSYYKDTGIGTASMLFDSNEKNEFKMLRDISFEWQYRDKVLDEDELKMVKTAVRQAIPASVYKTMNWGPFAEKREFKNAGFKYRMVIDPKALASVSHYRMPEVYTALVKYMKSIPPVQADPQTVHRGEGSQSNSVEDYFKDSLETISFKMAVVLNPGYSNEERARAFSELRFNDLFGKIGPGFLVSLLPETNLNKLVVFEVSMSADDAKMEPFVFGTPPDRKVYEAAAYIRSVLSDDEFETITQMMKSAKRP